MDNNERPLHPLANSGLVPAPIHASDDITPVRICVLARSEPDPAAGWYVLLREVPGSRVYLGAVCDAEARIQEWVEIWVQTIEFHDLAFSSYQERLTNHTFDQRWRSEYELSLANRPAGTSARMMRCSTPSACPLTRPRRSGICISRTPPGQRPFWQPRRMLL